MMVTFNPREPSPAPPGTEEKLELLAARYSSGLPLFNPEDAPHSNKVGWTALRNQANPNYEPYEFPVSQIDDEDEP